MAESVLKALKEVRSRLQDAVNENTDKRASIERDLPRGEAKALLTEIGAASSEQAKSTLRSMSNLSELPLSKMMMYLTRAKTETETVKRENVAINEVVVTRCAGKLGRASDLDNKGMKVMEVFKERKDQQEAELKAKLARLRGSSTFNENTFGRSSGSDTAKAAGEALSLPTSGRNTQALARIEAEARADAQAARAKLEKMLEEELSDATRKKAALMEAEAGSLAPYEKGKVETLEKALAEANEKLAANKVKTESLVDALQEAREERDMATQKVKRLHEMIQVMEELQEELTGSMDPTMQTLTNLREVVKAQEKELEAKSLSLKKYKTLADANSFAEDKAEYEAKIKELTEMVTTQAEKLREVRETMQDDLVAVASAKKKGETNKVLLESMHLASKVKTKDQIEEDKKIVWEALNGPDEVEAPPPEMDPSIDPSVKKELEALRKELEDERNTRKQLAATLMELMGGMNEDQGSSFPLLEGSSGSWKFM
mmetsp:Transcript_32189/g.70237  ORF Transcript_32189/g.70237 Transcript_32189/m.70237 type:complete len:488 (-) Transcript_32189:178-1641(-)|eukprot:CAMPEP_0118924870 /NCGR_PEP_ID=MMETSP1169-20130426/2798_1 /TAXON_ID=36882 /ORGANISM="Pyramimonas obovata, Strain CCMP722" /LENGTH=487 /DNA_ID=CAMNT_0006866009 /DNA_START=271 /DNA_END=1734 /DNA_ORIENTATION=+